MLQMSADVFHVFFIVSERAFFTMAFFPACVAGVISNKVCVSTVLVRLEIRWMPRLFKLQDTENRVTFERRVRNICSCVSHHGCDLDHNHLFMASPMSLHDVFVSGFMSSKRCSFSQRCRSFEAFVMQDLVDAGLSHGKAFTGEISDGSTQPCRHCHKETQRSKARVVVLLFGYLERKQS